MSVANGYPETAPHWNSELEADLIEEVHNRRFLWDISNTLYLKKSVKRSGFEDIAEVLQTRWPAYRLLLTVEALMKKFSTLKSYFIREFRKNKALNAATKGKNIKNRWVHYKRLYFLLECRCLDDCISSLNDSSIEDDTEIYPQVSSPQTSESSKLESITSCPSLDYVIENMVLQKRNISTDETSGSEEDGKFPEICSVDSLQTCVKLEPESIPSSSSPTVDISENISRQKRKVSTDENNEDVNRRNCDERMEMMEEDGKFPKRFKRDFDESDEYFLKFIRCQLQLIRSEKHRDSARLEILNVIMKYKYKL